MTTIAIVDDEEATLRALDILFRDNGYTTRLYRDGESALAAITKNEPDIVLLDVKMPRMDGTTVLTRLRNVTSLPVIIVTSLDSETDELIGLTIGADDFVSKPVSNKVLLARVAAVLRRAQTNVAPAIEDDRRARIVHGRLMLDPQRQSCFWGEHEIRLTTTEYVILEALAERPGQIKKREHLLTRAYADDLDVEERAIDTHVKRIRAKFRAVDPTFNAITTTYGAGYSFSDRAPSATPAGN